MQVERHHIEPILSVNFKGAGPVRQKLLSVVGGALEHVLLLDQLNAIYHQTLHLQDGRNFHEPELQDLFILVDPLARETSTYANVRALRETLNWLKGGAMLVAFPAGEVSHIDLLSRKVTDPEWSDSIARIIRATGADALPVCFSGANGLAFQVLGLVHPRLRTALLPHEFLNKRDKTIPLRIGSPIPFNRLAAFKTDHELMAYLR